MPGDPIETLATVEPFMHRLEATALSLRRFLPEVFARTLAPMDVATLAQVPRKTREKEAGAGRVATQADRVQQCTAQGTSGKVGGAHGR